MILLPRFRVRPRAWSSTALLFLRTDDHPSQFTDAKHSMDLLGRKSCSQRLPEEADGVCFLLPRGQNGNLGCGVKNTLRGGQRHAEVSDLGQRAGTVGWFRGHRDEGCDGT